LIVREDIWSGETKLPGLFSLAIFDSAAAAGDTAGAEEAGRQIVGCFNDPMERGAVRLVLAARALLSHNNLRLADGLILERERKGDPKAKLERVLLTAGLEAADTKNHQLVRDLLQQKKIRIGSLLKTWTESRWLHYGATEELLHEVLYLAGNARNQNEILLREALALAFLLNDRVTIQNLLGSHPELERSYNSVLPLAAFLCSRGNPAVCAEKKSVVEYAELYEHLNVGTAALMASLKDKRHSLAIVGNSPCEIGSGNGPLIDDHDLVARFNLFSTDEKFVSDYGNKCNVHVRLPDRENDNQSSVDLGITLLNRPDLLYRQRSWANILVLCRAGATVSFFPTGFHQPLYRKLGGEPSAGIAFCSLVKEVRGVLPRSSCFGFAFVDQIGSRATSAHYFRNARPSFKHQWTREKALFEELTASPESACSPLASSLKTTEGV
jgi:hypothetical protein